MCILKQKFATAARCCEARFPGLWDIITRSQAQRALQARRGSLAGCGGIAWSGEGADRRPGRAQSRVGTD